MAQIFVEKLINIDFTYFDLSRGLVGETLWVDVELQGCLDHQGMVLDFAWVKSELKANIESLLDHKLIIPSVLSEVEVSREQKQVSLCMQNKKGYRYHICLPAVAVCLIPTNAITCTGLEHYLSQQQWPIISANQFQVRFSLYPESYTEAYFHYSHGLPLHQGPCQRIAHGHRSRIEININDKRQRALEQRWCQKWKDIYIGSEQDIKNRWRCEDIEYISFAYTAGEGFFELSLPLKQCYLIPCASTIEQISQHVADQIKQDQLAERVRVCVFEGAHKGAIGMR